MLKLRAFLAAGLLALFAMPSLAASLVWNPAPLQIRTATGTVATGAKGYFFLAGTTTPLTTYSDSAQTTPQAHPVVADSNGVFAPIYIPYSATGYKVRVQTSANVTIQEIDGIGRDAPPALGGASGITVAQEMVFNTGDVKWSPRTGTLTGFVRLNGRSIGNAASGSLERAHDDTSALFTFLWDNCANAQCQLQDNAGNPISRGASASADFTSNSRIILPDGRGRGLFGIDDMGSAAASRLVGATIASGNATTPSSSGGAATHTLTTAQLASHSHTLTATGTITVIGNPTITINEPNGSAGHQHTVDAPSALVTVQSGSGTPSIWQGSTTVSSTLNPSGVTASASGGTYSFSGTPGQSTNTNGSGTAHNVMPPFLLGGWYMRL